MAVFTGVRTSHAHRCVHYIAWTDELDSVCSCMFDSVSSHHDSHSHLCTRYHAGTTTRVLTTIKSLGCSIVSHHSMTRTHTFGYTHMHAYTISCRYDDAGAYYDHVVPPFEGVPNDEAPCHLRDQCSPTSNKFDFRRLGLRTSSMLISPWVAKGAVFQEPKGPCVVPRAELFFS